MSWWSRRRSASNRRNGGGAQAGQGAVAPDCALLLPGASAGGDSRMRDELTGLRNRLDLKDYLDEAVACAPPIGSRPALLCLDIDEFKRLNGSHGEQAGDELLRALSALLTSVVSNRGTVFRTGRDEFAALLTWVTPEEAVKVGTEILYAVSQPLELVATEVRPTASIGIVMLGERTRADGVLRDADLTMHRAKAEGGNRVDIYSGELDYWARCRKRDLDRLTTEVEELRLENQALSQALTVDPRTGLANAAAFEADQLQVHARRARTGEQYSIVLADLDLFHEYKQSYKPSVTQETLLTVAKAIRETVRQSDRAYRYGWQEFTVLLPGGGLRDAVVAAERIRSKIEQLAIEHPEAPSGFLTATVAVVEAGFRHPAPKDVIAELGDLLLEGKQAGRNRIVWPH